jgi:glycerol-3-phosphate dehydrogenase (NAD(P)+)
VTVAVLGAGSWGTTIAVHLARGGHEVRLWSHDPAELAPIAADRENRKFLPGIALPEGVKVQPELQAALHGAAFTVVAVPSQAVRDVSGRAAALRAGGIVVCASKGLELNSHRRMSEVLAESLHEPDAVILTGPSHAEEVSRGIPTSVVAAARDESRARATQDLFASPTFRVYTNQDVIGCEMGAALKNVVAIAAGVCDGLGFGDNTKGALLTRGLAEISRLGAAMGGKRETFFGLAGMGDLIATATSRHSRNRHVGERLGLGESLDQVLGSMVMVAEGVHTARAASELGRERGVEMPITDQVCGILFQGVKPREALERLMTRDLKSEA